MQPLKRTFRLYLLAAALTCGGTLCLSSGGPAGAARGRASLRPEVALQFGHSGEVKALAFSPDGKRLASAGKDHVIRIWGAHTGQLERCITTGAKVQSLAVSPAGQVAAGTEWGGVRVWDATTGASLWTVDHPGWIPDLDFSPDGKRLASVGDSEWRVWDARTGRPLGRARTEGRAVFAASFSPWPSKLFVGAGDFSPDGKVSNGAISLWDVVTGSHAATLTGLKQGVVAVACSADEGTLAVVEDQTLHIADLNTPSEGRAITISGTLLPCVFLAPDGKTVFAASREGEVLAVDAATGARRTAGLPQPGPLSSFAVSPDGKVFAGGGEDGQVRFWSLASGTLERRLTGQTEGVASVAFSPDGKSLTSGGGQLEGRLRMWDLQAMELRRSLPGHAGWVFSVAYSPDGKLLASGGSRLHGEVKLWDARTGALLRTLDHDPTDVRAVAFSSDSRLLACALRRRVKLWDTATGRLLRTMDAHADWVNGVAFSPDGKLLATSGADGPTSSEGSVQLWDVNTGTRVRTVFHTDTWMTKVAFSPDGSRLLAGSWDNTARVWETRTGTLLLTLKGHAEDVDSVAYSPDGSRIATGGSDRIIRVWDAAAGRCLHVLERHDDVVFTVAFSPDSRTLASGSPDGAVKLWDAASGRLRASLFGLPPAPPEGRPIKAESRPIKAESRPIGGEPAETLETSGYLVMTPAGYSGSAEADRYVRFRLGGELFPAECFQAAYYRPELVRECLAGRTPPPAPTFRGPYPPRVAFVSPAPGARVNGGQITVTVEAGDDSRVTRVHLLVNGAGLSVPLRKTPSNPSGKRSAGNLHPFTARVSLPVGSSVVKLQAVAVDEDGLQSPRAETTITQTVTAPVRGRLLGLCVGVSRYSDVRLNLRYAGADATSVAEALRRQAAGVSGSVIYNDARIQALTDSQATRVEVLKSLDRLVADAEQSDTVVLFLAGHGWRRLTNDPRRPPEFYFATHEVSRRDVAESALPWSTVLQRLTALSRKSRRVVVLLDACHSGSAATNEELTRAVLSSRAGVVVLTASRGSEVSLESRELGHGAFTSALLEALGGRATLAGETAITLWDLSTYVRRRVKELTGGAQSPQVPFLSDFDTDSPFAVRE